MYYFCYSSALDQEATGAWAKDHGYDPGFCLTQGRKAHLPGFNLIADWPSNYWGGRVLSVETKPGSTVEGVLFELPDSFHHAVRHKEGVVTGVAVELQASVEVASSDSRQPASCVLAYVYAVNPQRKSLEGSKSHRYFETLERAYKFWGLSTDPFSKLS